MKNEKRKNGARKAAALLALIALLLPAFGACSGPQLNTRKSTGAQEEPSVVSFSGVPSSSEGSSLPEPTVPDLTTPVTPSPVTSDPVTPTPVTPTPVTPTPVTTTPVTPTPTPVTPTPVTPSPVTPTPVTPTPVTPTPVTPDPGREKRVRFLAAGDNIIHEAVFTDAMALAAAQAQQGGSREKYYFDSMYDGVASMIANADVAFVNFESPAAGEQYGVSGYPIFNAPVQALQALERVGFDVLNLANNHMLDMDGTCPGLEYTKKNADKTSMLILGGYTAKDYDTLRILVKNGIRIAFLSYTDCMNYDAQGKKRTVYPGSPMIVPYANETDIRRQTALAKVKADFLVVSMHWGTENSFAVDNSQKKWAKLLNECGADVILGHHSHTIQSVEWIGQGEHKTLCYYSLGNFLSTQHPIRNLTGIFGCFDLVVGENGEKSVENERAVPHMTWYSTSRDALQIYFLSDVTETLIKTHGSQLRTKENGGTFTLSDVKKFVSGQLGAYGESRKIVEKIRRFFKKD